MIRLAGNDPMWLDEPGPGYLLHVGSIAVFATDRGSGVRRYLFTVDPGETLDRHQHSGGARWRLMAVPLQDCLVSTQTPPLESRHVPPALKEKLCAALPALEECLMDEFIPALHRALDRLEANREELLRERFEARRAVNQNAHSRALDHLAKTFHSDSDAGPDAVGGSSLFLAVRAVCHALGIRVSPLSVEERYGEEHRDPLVLLAHRSGFRLRRVVLAGQWWRQENGPLLAFLENFIGDGPAGVNLPSRERRRPVALLPVPGSLWRKPGYVVFEPSEALRMPVDFDVASLLNPMAVTFYRPLPENASALRLCRLALTAHRKDVRAIVLCGLLALLLGLAAPQATNVLISQAIPDADGNLVWEVALAILAAALGSMMLRMTQGIATLRAQTAIYNMIQPGVWDHLLKLPPAFFRTLNAAELRLRADGITRIHQLFTADATRLLLTGAASLLVLVLMLYYSVPLALIGASGGVLMAAATWFSVRDLVGLHDIHQRMEGDLSGLVLQLVNAVSKLRVAGAARRAFAIWAGEYSRKQRHALKIQGVKDRLYLLNITTPTVAIAVSFFYMLAHGGLANMPLGTFLAFNAALAIFLNGVASAGDALAGLSLSGAVWRRTVALLREPIEDDSSKLDPGRLRGDIAIERVNFRYRADGPLTLDAVTIRANAGECIALTGPSGGGKSTLLNLLLGFETPASGAIYIDGYDLASLDISAVRRQIGVVTQDSRIMSQSIYDNITCGGISSMEHAWEAARLAGFAEDIEQMPMGMHTVISEGGGNISGGQRQRLLIARALVLKPGILIFDEATSALDNRTQAIVTASLRKINATRILVAHRLSTIRDADRIYVVDAGRVVQFGTFDELVSQGGAFRRLIDRQSVE